MKSAVDTIDKMVAQWAVEKPDLDTLPTAIFGRMARLYKHMEIELNAYYKEIGLTMGEFDVLATLRRSGAPYRLTPSQLLDTVLLTSGAMTNRLDRLQAKGLVSRMHSKEDRRSVSVALTEPAITLINQAVEKNIELQKRLMISLSIDDKRILNGMLKRWLTQLDPVENR